MSVTFEDINENLRRVAVTGRLDVSGTDAIADEFGRLVTSAPKHVMVDLSSVSFLGSVGVRVLLSSAKTLQQDKRKMALVIGDDTIVAQTLEAMGIDQLIPVYGNADDARRTLT